MVKVFNSLEARNQELNRYMTQWYALYTKPHKERSVAFLLENQNIQTFLPETVTTTASKQRRKVPFFRGYLFANLNLNSGDPSAWRWTPGLRYIVAYGDVPIVVPGEVIKLIDHRLNEMAITYRNRGHNFEPGDLVRIKSGPFKDMLAVFEGPMSPSDRVQILIEAMNRSVRARIEAENLEKVTGKVAKAIKKRPRRSRGRGRPIA